MAGNHSARHVSQHAAPHSSSRSSRAYPAYDEEEDYGPGTMYEQRTQEEHAYKSERKRMPSQSKKNSRGPGLFTAIFRDVFITGLILCVFAMFHHVLPRINEKGQTAQPVSVIQTPAPVQTPETASEPVQAENTDNQGQSAAEPEETQEPDNRTEWQKKFEDKFTDEVVITENSYTSPEVSITVNKCTFTDSPYGPTVYYLADVYVASLDYFKTYFANGRLTYYGYESPLSAAKNAGAILSINGDYADNQKEGFLVRNGELYYEEKSVFDICVLYYDGVMETYTPDEYEVADILARSPVQSWKFGPALLDAAGNAKTEFNETASGITVENPRSAIGYFEPGHYCLMIADGRQDFSRGLTMEELSSVFASLGCKAAYNLDGGASAVMVFNGRIVNNPSNGGRDCGDIVYVCSPAKEEEAN